MQMVKKPGHNVKARLELKTLLLKLTIIGLQMPDNKTEKGW